MRAVDENELGARIGHFLDLVNVDAEFVFFADRVEPGFEAKRFGEHRKSGESGALQDHIGARFSGEPHQHKESFGRAGCNLHGFRIDIVHVGDGST